MNKVLSIITIVTALSTVPVVSSQAQAIHLLESFDYSSSASLSGLDGGIGWAGAWSGAGATVSDGGLSYAGYENTSGNAASFGVDGFRTGRDIVTGSSTGSFGAYLDGNGDIAQGGDLWISFLVQGPETGTGFSAIEFHRENSTDDGNRLLRLTTETDSTWRFRAESIATGSGPVSYELGARTGGADLIVFRFGLSSAVGGDVIDVYLNPATTAIPGTPSASLTGLNITLDRLNLARFSSGTTIIAMDEIRMGDSFEAVMASIPEPSTSVMIMAVLAAGVVTVVRRRRK